MFKRSIHNKGRKMNKKKVDTLTELKQKVVEDMNEVLKKHGFILQPYAFLTNDGRISANVRVVPSKEVD
jgi:hypothetical protein